MVAVDSSATSVSFQLVVGPMANPACFKQKVKVQKISNSTKIGNPSERLWEAPLFPSRRPPESLPLSAGRRGG